MDEFNPSTTETVTTPGSTDTAHETPPVGAVVQTPPTDGSPEVPPVQAVPPVDASGQPVQPTPVQATPPEPPVDPLADVFDTNAGKKNVDIGKLDFDKAAETHLKEMGESLSSGDPQLIEKLGKLKPKMLARVVSELGNKFTIGDSNAEFSNFEELNALLGNNLATHSEAGADDVATSNLRSNIDVKFLTALQTKGITFEAFKGTPQYQAVAKAIADKVAVLREAGISLANFDKHFDFNLHFDNAMRGVDAKKAVADAQLSAQRIASANQGNPLTTPVPLAGLAAPNAQGGKAYPNMLPEASMWQMSRAQRLAYAKDWTDESGTIQFAK